MQHRFGVTSHANPVQTLMIGMFRSYRPHAVKCLLGCPDIGEQYVLEARTNCPHGEMPTSILLDLDHSCEVWEQLDGPTKIVQIVHRPRLVLCHKFHIVP